MEWERQRRRVPRGRRNIKKQEKVSTETGPRLQDFKIQSVCNETGESGTN